MADEVTHCGKCGSDNIEVRKDSDLKAPEIKCNACGDHRVLSEVILLGYNDKRFSINLDVKYDENQGLFEGMITFLEREEIKFELIEWNGPGGGWPIIKFTGTKDALAVLCGDYFDDRSLIQQIQEVK